VDLPGSGYGSLAGSCECGDEPSGSGATELVRIYKNTIPVTVSPPIGPNKEGFI
jgi:hypothetical protein